MGGGATINTREWVGNRHLGETRLGAGRSFARGATLAHRTLAGARRRGVCARSSVDRRIVDSSTSVPSGNLHGRGRGRLNLVLPRARRAKRPRRGRFCGRPVLADRRLSGLRDGGAIAASRWLWAAACTPAAGGRVQAVRITAASAHLVHFGASKGSSKVTRRQSTGV